MDFHSLTYKDTLKLLNTDMNFGLKNSEVEKSRTKYGDNVISKKKKTGILGKIFSVLKEPMIVILIFSLILTLGVNIGKKLKTGNGDFTECIGIFIAISLSVGITLIMEGSSEKAFSVLNRIYDDITVKVIRNGKTVILPRKELCVGDIVLLDSGDKICADGRLIESNFLETDESALTGESRSVAKNCNILLNKNTPLAERSNCVYSGTFIKSGNGRMVVTAVGDKTELGGIAGELKKDKEDMSPLQLKLEKLGKTVTIIGIITAIFVFLVSLIRLIMLNSLDFSSVQDLFISCIVLIVAAVPEGLPTIVAVSLALNMIKLAKENALIKKMTATETTGAISVILSDKTGTLTQNKMAVSKFLGYKNGCFTESVFSEEIVDNFVCNSNVQYFIDKGKIKFNGSATETAISEFFVKKCSFTEYKNLKDKYKIERTVPFTSDKKYMVTKILKDGKEIRLMKGAPEKVLGFCDLSENEKNTITKKITEEQKNAGRVLCFAHSYQDKYIYDGFVSLFDPVRSDVYGAVKMCKRAGIKVKILTGDNMVTAYAIAKELKIAKSESEVINASEIENLEGEKLREILSKVTVIARSTPIVKLKVVKELKSMGETVAVTGDGINDAPAIRHSDVGIAMGKAGSEITKEAADIVLLDDGFSTIVKAVSFGRNVYRNIQRFICFQLSVNLSALLFIVICAITGNDTPFNTLQLLWINVIMDGPPALTLGLEGRNDALMELPPVKKDRSIITKNMLIRIAFNGIFIGIIMAMQYFFNILDANAYEEKSAVFTLFIVFQLFNAFNCRELGSESILSGIGKNKIMLFTFLSVFMIHFVIVEVFYAAFGIYPLRAIVWFKTVVLSLSVIIITEIAKLFYRALGTVVKKDCKRIKKQIAINKKASRSIN